MGSPSAVLTLGLGSWGSVNEVITLGYGSGAAVVLSPTPYYAEALGIAGPGPVATGFSGPGPVATGTKV